MKKNDNCSLFCHFYPLPSDIDHDTASPHAPAPWRIFYNNISPKFLTDITISSKIFGNIPSGENFPYSVENLQLPAEKCQEVVRTQENISRLQTQYPLRALNFCNLHTFFYKKLNFCAKKYAFTCVLRF